MYISIVVSQRYGTNMQRKTLPSYIIYICSINFLKTIKIITCKCEKHTAQETEKHCLILSQACNR